MSTPVNETYIVPSGQPIPSQLFYGSSFTALATYADATIVIHDTMPIAGEDGVSSNTMIKRPVAILKLSPQALKEFASVLAVAVKQYEKAFGEIPVDILS